MGVRSTAIGTVAKEMRKWGISEYETHDNGKIKRLVFGGAPTVEAAPAKRRDPGPEQKETRKTPPDALELARGILADRGRTLD